MSTDNQQERSKNQINPWYIVGFTEGEGTFHIAIYFDKESKYNLKIIPEFHINQSYLRIETLKAIQNYFNCGYIKPNHQKNPKDVTYVLVVRNKNDLTRRIIPFFRKYSLISKKQKDFQIFSTIVEMMIAEKHKESSGIEKIIKLAYSMNNHGKYRKVKLSKLFDFLKSSETIR